MKRVGVNRSASQKEYPEARAPSMLASFMPGGSGYVDPDKMLDRFLEFKAMIRHWIRKPYVAR